MRGTLYAPVERVGYVGLIPTYAGNTYIRVGVKGYGGAHPHVCGEHEFIGPDENEDWGSSPRMRGTHERGEHIPGWKGLIPTYAGNTLLSVEG